MPRNAKLFIVDNMDSPGVPGAIQPVYWNDSDLVVGFNHACPCGCGAWSWIRLHNPEGAKFDRWLVMEGKIPGDIEHLRLSPSIGIRPKDAAGRYHWHGYIENGSFVER